MTNETQPSRRLLLADDDEAFRGELAESLRQAGFAVTECRHGVDLIRHLKCLRDPATPDDFDMIITDIRMPGVTGMSILEGLRDRANAPPIILITGFGDQETRSQAKRLGAVAVLDKPFEITDLLSKIQETLVA